MSEPVCLGAAQPPFLCVRTSVFSVAVIFEIFQNFLPVVQEEKYPDEPQSDPGSGWNAVCDCGVELDISNF